MSEPMSDSAPRIPEKAIEFWAKREFGKRPTPPWGEIGDQCRAGFYDRARDDLIAIRPLLCGELEEERDQVRAVIALLGGVNPEEHVEQLREFDAWLSFTHLSPKDKPWRVGTKLGRTVYRQLGPTPSEEDTLLGMMESAGLAETVVRLHNASREQANTHLSGDGERLKEIAQRLDDGYHAELTPEDADLFSRLSRESGAEERLRDQLREVGAWLASSASGGISGEEVAAVAGRIEAFLATRLSPDRERCARDSDWCDGRICRDRGIDCPNAERSPENSSGVEEAVALSGPVSDRISFQEVRGWLDEHGEEAVRIGTAEMLEKLSEGTRKRLEAAGRVFDTRVKNQESVHEPLPENRIREIYESPATTQKPQDEEER